MIDNIDKAYSFFVHISNLFRDHSLGSLTEQLYREESVWHGTWMHGFYQFGALNDDYLHLIADYDTDDSISIDGRIVPKQLVFDAERSIVLFKEKYDGINCEMVDHYVFDKAPLSGYPLRLVGRNYGYTYGGLEDCFNGILATFPEIR